ncbi:MAG: Ca2+-transporting ATPase [Microgenomates group bacterium Gr01-1014_93]|nr:MAG: Ca2+-transporting ATPase [Microgenomates group bacterium Gr01-1014_93]
MTRGLTTFQAKEYLIKYGPNLLPDKSQFNTITLILSQFKNIFFWVLTVAMLLSFIFGDKTDGFLILTILLLNSALGFWQEFKASRELQALRKLEVFTSRVIRNGIEVEIPSLEIVPGDIVVLESGDKIPADGIVMESYNLSVNESSLTGESLPKFKSVSREDNLTYFGTIVSTGRAKIQITKTGAETRFGKIALTLSSVEEKSTPLEISLNNLAKGIGILAQSRVWEPLI